MDSLGIGKCAVDVEDQGVHGPFLSLVHVATIAKTDADLNSEILWTPVRHPLVCYGEHTPCGCSASSVICYWVKAKTNDCE